MAQISPRLPGVHILPLHAAGPEYSRWRRSLKFAAETKGTWKYCSGECLMPMLKTTPTTKPLPTPTSNVHPSLLDERRGWVRQDREAKLDIFLSLSEDVMMQVFEAAPPLPPSSPSAKEMLGALDDHFTKFKFEDYHHAFCHFLNLHIDDYSNVEDFNQEFLATLEDLIDYGKPLTNIQACSAYFSKLRCSQNPWVARKLQEWDSQSEEPDLIDILKESPSWTDAEPLATKLSQAFSTESIPEEPLEDSSSHFHSDSDDVTDHFGSEYSSSNSHSRQISSATTSSLGITVHSTSNHVSADATISNKEQQIYQEHTTSNRYGSNDQVSGTSITEECAGSPIVPQERPTGKNLTILSLFPLPVDRPLPPLPAQVMKNRESVKPSRPSSPHVINAMIRSPPSADFMSRTASSTPQLQLRLETIHPSVRAQSPTPEPLRPASGASGTSGASGASRDVPSGIENRSVSRSRTPTLDLKFEQPRKSPPMVKMERAKAIRSLIPPVLVSQSVSEPEVKIKASGTRPLGPSEEHLRPQSSRTTLPVIIQEKEEPNEEKSDGLGLQHASLPGDYVLQAAKSSPLAAPPPVRRALSTSTTVSDMTLPLQGNRDSQWEYLYDRRSSPREQGVFAVDVSVSTQEDMTALPPLPKMFTEGKAAVANKTMSVDGKSAAATFTTPSSCSRSPLPIETAPPLRPWSAQPESYKSKEPGERKLGLGLGRPPPAASSGAAVKSSIGPVSEFNDDKGFLGAAKRNMALRKKSWAVNLDLARFSTHKGVKEMI